MALGTVDKQQAGLSKIEVYNIMTVVCAKLNNTPYIAKFLDQLGSPVEAGQDLNMELVCPNSWRTTCKLNSADSALIYIPLCLSEHQEQVQEHLTGLQLYHTRQILPLLLLDVPSIKRNYTTDLRVGIIVAFYKSGAKKVGKK